jgi:ATP-dependent DNA helicase RecG
VHRDYSSAYPAKVIIEKDWLRTENWCIPRRHGNIMSDEFTPYPKNPLIQQFFANIGRTDTIGSGVRNLYKYTPMYSDGGKPELIEDDVFRINIPLDRIAADEATEQKTLSEREQKIYNMICENLHLSVEQVMAELDISRSTVFRDYAKIKKVTGAVYDKKTSTWTLQLNKKHIYRRFSYIGKRNYISYALKAAKIMNEPSINKQIKSHWKRLQAKIKLHEEFNNEYFIYICDEKQNL